MTDRRNASALCKYCLDQFWSILCNFKLYVFNTFCTSQSSTHGLAHRTSGSVWPVAYFFLGLAHAGFLAYADLWCTVYMGRRIYLLILIYFVKGMSSLQAFVDKTIIRNSMHLWGVTSDEWVTCPHCQVVLNSQVKQLHHQARDCDDHKKLGLGSGPLRSLRWLYDEFWCLQWGITVTYSLW